MRTGSDCFGSSWSMRPCESESQSLRRLPASWLIAVSDDIVGDCFVVAAHLLFDDDDDGLYLDDTQEAYIVHGTPILRGSSPDAGKRYWHGWIEVFTYVEFGDDLVAVVSVIDRSNGLNVRTPQQLYYNMGQLDEKHVWRFNREQARDKMLKLGHYGPWVDDYEKIASL